MKGVNKVQQAADILRQKGVQQILIDNKYGLGPGKELDDLLDGHVHVYNAGLID